MLATDCLANPLIRYLVTWLLVCGAFGFAIMGVDKERAVRHERRISERTLFGISFIGGFWGVLLGSEIFHHKNSKLGFLLITLVAGAIWGLILIQLLPWANCFT